MSLKLLFTVVSGDYPKMMKQAQDRIARTATATIRQAADQMKREGRSAMAAGGMSTRFQNALRSKVYPSSAVSLTPAAVIFSKIPWAGVFEDAPSIAGKPLLWIPIEQNLPLQSGGKKWTPKDFINVVGPLRAGKHGARPILFAQVAVGKAGGVLALPSRAGTKRAALARKNYNAAKAKWVPVFVGVTSVTDPKRFDISAVVSKVNDQLGELYSRNWEASQNG